MENITKQTPALSFTETVWVEKPKCHAALDDVADDVRQAAWAWLNATVRRRDAEDCGGEGNPAAWTAAEQVTARALAAALQKFYAPSSHGISAIDDARRAAVKEHCSAGVRAWHAADGGAAE